MAASAAEKYLNSFSDYEKTTGYSYNAAYFNLRRMERLLELLDSPHKKVPSIHITGTKGKGSTAAYIASILTACGLKTGLYTSPHILTFRERIKIDGKMISWPELNGLVKSIKPAVEKLEKESLFGLPTFFEVYTALGFIYFAKRKVSVMVLEVGMGGRLDATNVVTPLVSVITPISLDHIKELGGTLANIAGEKSGIIKKGVPVVVASQVPQALAVLKRKAKSEGSKFILCRKETLLKTGMVGKHQAQNAALALTAVTEAAPFLGLTASILKKNTKVAILKTHLPGRIQVAKKSPYIILDAAHNSASGKVLLASLKVFKYSKLIMLIGMSSNKDISGFLKVFENKAYNVIYVKASNYRSAEPKDLLQGSNTLKSRAYMFKTVAEGFKLAKKLAGKKDMICITGSFYVLHDVFKILKLPVTGDE